MKVLGITGGVGAGKSTVLAWMEEHYGARVIQADKVAFDLQQPGERCCDAIVSAFGTDILRPDGTIDRALLSAAVFSDHERLALLNSLVHPAVKRRITEEIARERQKGEVPFVVVEAALLLEDRYDLICDEIWYIRADERIREERLEKSRGYTREKSRQIMDSQLDDAAYLRKCNFVIDNSGDFVENTRRQIDEGLIEHGFL